MPIYNAIVSGIGGQGVITVGTILKKAALIAGIQVSGSERRGGAQREGHVSTMIRYRWSEDGFASSTRSGICSPMIPAGRANLLIGLEPLEALRVSKYLNENSVVIANLFPLPPIAVRLGEADYPAPDRIYELFRKLTNHVYGWDLTSIAEKAFRNLHAVNSLSLGIASRIASLPVSESHLLQCLRQEGKPEEIQYFQAGVELADARCS